MDTPHPVDAAITEWSDLYTIGYLAGTWIAVGRLWDSELRAASWRELRDLMIADPARKAAT